MVTSVCITLEYHIITHSDAGFDQNINIVYMRCMQGNPAVVQGCVISDVTSRLARQKYYAYSKSHGSGIAEHMTFLMV